MMLRSILVYMVLLHGWLGHGVVISSFNGTTTLDEQASVNVGSSSASRDSPDRTNIKFRPLFHDHLHSGASNSLSLYVKPPHKNQRRPPLFPPPIHHSHHAYHQPLPHPPKYYPYPLEPGYSDDYYATDDECSLMAPLIAIKTAFVALFKVAVAKLPLLAVKLFAKAVALFIILGPILLPLILLFPVPVFGLNNFGTGFAITGTGGIGNNNGNGNANNGNFNNNNNNNNRVPNNNLVNFKQDARNAALSRLPQFTRGPCWPRIACEMGYWAFREKIAWILDHATENVSPIFPKLFNSWKRAYHLGGKGRDCGTLYFCPSADKVISIIEKSNLQINNVNTTSTESQESVPSVLEEVDSHPRIPPDIENNQE